MTQPAIRVALVDDQPLFCKGLETILQAHGFDVVGSVHCGEDALWLVQATDAQVVLMDLHMPGIGGVEAIKRLRAQRPDVAVIVLTTFDEDEMVFDALRHGAVGYLLKGVFGEELSQAIRATLQGASSLTPSISRKVVAEFARLSRLEPQLNPQDLELSARELDVLRGVSGGFSNQEIADHLGLAQGTVKNHVSNILRKLGIQSRTEAALLAREHGIV